MEKNDTLEGKGRHLWKAIEEKAQGLDVPKEKTILVSMIGIQRMASFLGVKKCGEGMVDAIKVDGLPQNPDFAEIIIRCKSKYAQDNKGNDIKGLFNEKRDWKKNLKKRARVMQEVVSCTIMCPSWLHILFTELLFLSNMSTQYL